MGTKVQYKTCFGGYNPMRDLNDDLNGTSWALFCGEKNIHNYTTFIPRTAANVYPGYDNNALKQKMLEHEAIFKHQVHELHRLYRVQRDMMEEKKTKEHYKHRGSSEPSSSSIIQGSQVPTNDVREWHNRGYPWLDSCHHRSTVSGVENVNSPFSYKKGNIMLASRVAQNGFPKEFEVSEARPSKVRKKLFDLQLPADEYLDTDKQLDNSVSGDPSFTPNRGCKTATESSPKFTVGCAEICGLQEGLSSVSHFRGSIRLADLNEPIDFEEVTESSPANVFGHSDGNGGAENVNLSGKPNQGFLGLPKEARQKSIHTHPEPVTVSRVRNPIPFMNSSNDASTWPQVMQSLGTPADNLKPKIISFHTHPSLCSSQSLNKGLQSFALSNHISGDKWHVTSSFPSNPYLSSDLPSHNGFYQGSSSGSKDLPVCFSSTGSNTTSVHMRNGMEKAFSSSSFVDIKIQKDTSLNRTLPKNELDMPVILRDLANADGNRKPEVQQPSFPWLRTKPTFDNDAPNSRREVIYIDASPPRASPSLLAGKSKAVIDLNQLYDDTSDLNNLIGSKNKTDGIPIVKNILGVPIFEELSVPENRVSALVPSTTETEHANHEMRSRSFDINVACDASLLESEEPEMDELVGENHLDRSSCARNFIDLNTWVAEDEDPPVPTVASISGPKKIVVEIDLEAPAVPEEEDDLLPEREREQEQGITPYPPDNATDEQAEDEDIRIAVEAIVNISSCQHINQENVILPPHDAAASELLLWFADVVFTTSMSYKVMDDFEAMALQLPETKEEDFIPKPFIPEVQNVEETGTIALPNRPRRGQARRGRQRRDFQRDILPGLVSLSRHEVTEDLQTFGGLMKAMGHSWNSGLTRRNGSGRGRRRKVMEAAPEVSPDAYCSQLMQQLSNAEASLEDRSLTSWGKTTRRPRRQRCPVGNSPTAVLI